MKSLLKQNGTLLGILLSWLFINFICLIMGKDGTVEVINAKDNFLPFTDLKLLDAYDLSEFLVYGFSPIVIFIIIKLKNYENS
jgi:hypothetical protein